MLALVLLRFRVFIGCWGFWFLNNKKNRDKYSYFWKLSFYTSYISNIKRLITITFSKRGNLGLLSFILLGDLLFSFPSKNSEQITQYSALYATLCGDLKYSLPFFVGKSVKTVVFEGVERSGISSKSIVFSFSLPSLPTIGVAQTVVQQLRTYIRLIM